MARSSQTKTRPLPQVRARLLIGLSAVVAFCVIGCGIDDEASGESSSLESSPTPRPVECTSIDAGQAASDAAVPSVRDAASPSSTATFVAAKTSGTKCQATTTISPDAKELSISFEDFSVDVTPERGVSSEVCAVTLDLALPEGQVVAVEQVEADANANLGRGVVGTVESSLSFVTSLDRVVASATSLTGPFSGPIQYRGVIAADKRLFSSCSSPQRLTAQLRLALVNGEVRSTGTLSLTKLNPLRLTLRPCN